MGILPMIDTQKRKTPIILISVLKNLTWKIFQVVVLEVPIIMLVGVSVMIVLRQYVEIVIVKKL
jgi:hypothetical protein